MGSGRPPSGCRRNSLGFGTTSFTYVLDVVDQWMLEHLDIKILGLGNLFSWASLIRSLG